jgi:hypothetical protein
MFKVYTSKLTTVAYRRAHAANAERILSEPYGAVGMRSDEHLHSKDTSTL